METVIKMRNRAQSRKNKKGIKGVRRTGEDVRVLVLMILIEKKGRAPLTISHTFFALLFLTVTLPRTTLQDSVKPLSRCVDLSFPQKPSNPFTAFVRRPSRMG